MPTRLTLSLAPSRDFPVPKFTGYIARGVILHLVKSANPSKALDLHESNVLKPFAVEPLYFKARAKSPEGYLVDASSPCTMVIKVLDDSLVQDFVSYMSSNGKLMIRDCELFFRELNIEHNNYQEILSGGREDQKFGVDFNTPTYFSMESSAFYSVLPEPSRLMMNVLRIWNRFSTEKVDKETYADYWRFLSKNAGITRYELQTMPVKVERAKAKMGFVGRVNYELADPKYARLTNSLLKFAEFSNVGGGRTAGMGVVKVRSVQI